MRIMRIMTGRTSRAHRWVLLALMGGLLAALFPGTQRVEAQVPSTHGIGFAKGCDSPVNAGDAYRCGFLIANTTLLDTQATRWRSRR